MGFVHVQVVRFQAVIDYSLALLVEVFDVMMRHHIIKVIGRLGNECNRYAARGDMEAAG